MQYNITENHIHSVEKIDNDTGGRDEIYDFKINERKFVLYYDVAGVSRLVDADTDIDVVVHGIFENKNDLIELHKILKKIVQEQNKKDIQDEINELSSFFVNL